MLQLPFTLLGRRVAVQPDLQASSADFVLGASPVLPGIVFDEKIGQEVDFLGPGAKQRPTIAKNGPKPDFFPDLKPVVLFLFPKQAIGIVHK